MITNKADQLYLDEMNFHDLTDDYSNILATLIKGQDVTEVTISEDTTIIAIGLESGKINIFEHFEMDKESSLSERRIQDLTERFVSEFLHARSILKAAEKELNSYKITKDFNRDVQIEE